jgi:hypothetical protein
MCFGLRGDLAVKDGQLAHMDRDRTHSVAENLAFLCQECHGVYDKKSNRVLAFTSDEIRHYRDRLYSALGHDAFEWCLTVRADHSRFEAAKRVVDEAHAILLAFTREVTRHEGPVKS